MVRGGNSCSEGRKFKSQHRILDGHLSHLFVIKLQCLLENKWKRGPGWPIFLKMFELQQIINLVPRKRTYLLSHFPTRLLQNQRGTIRPFKSSSYRSSAWRRSCTRSPDSELFFSRLETTRPG